MATYAIGDIQGCWPSLQRLLKRVDFSPESDRAWLVGDLVNRGPDSLSVLRWAKGLGDRAVAVLGNHDLHLLARSEGLSHARRDDTLDEALSAPDREELLSWLRHRPLVHREDRHLMVHAGLLPQWNLRKIEANARFVEEILQGDNWREFLKIYRKAPNKISLENPDLLLGRHIINVFTRLRVCNDQGAIDLDFNGAPEKIPDGFSPWFDIPSRQWSDIRVIAGHWAALGLHQAPHVVTLDTGCVWGRHLTAMRLEDGEIFQQPAAEGEPSS